MSILAGFNYFPGSSEGIRRQQAALTALRGLSGVRAVNVQFKTDDFPLEGVRQVRGLELDSRQIAKCQGPPKPVMREIFDILANEAKAARCEWFLFFNSDINLTQPLIDIVAGSDQEALVFTRTDFRKMDRSDGEVMLRGQDVYAVRTTWWEANRGRFREYLQGETVWDNVYTVQLMRHAKGGLIERHGLCWHEWHEPHGRMLSPYRFYTQKLAAFDAREFNLWVEYFEKRAKLAAAEDIRSLQQRVFQAPFSVASGLIQTGRNVKAILRHEIQQRRNQE